MTPSNTAILRTHDSLPQKQQDSYWNYFTLKWRQRKLLVKLSQHVQQPYTPSLENEQWLVDCLSHSPVQLIRIDPDLGEVWLRLWADACKQANKAVFLRVPSAQITAWQESSFRWGLKRLINWSAAALLLLSLSPLMLGLALLIYVCSPGPIFIRQWCVGQRGKLFQALKFRTMAVNPEELDHQVSSNQKALRRCEADSPITHLGRWMRKYSLDELPQLLNVLRGEMSLVGPRPWSLQDAVKIGSEGQQQLNALPGIRSL